MHKKFVALVLVFSIICLSIVPAHAIQNYGITSNWTYNAIITYEALSDLAAQVAADIADGNCPSQFQGAHVDMRYDGTYWHIKVIDINDNIYYVGAHTGTVTGGTGTVYVAIASQITQVLWSIQGLVNTIDNNVNTLKTYINYIEGDVNNISNTVSAIVNHTAYLPGIDTTLRNISNALVDSSTNTSFVDAINNMSAKIMAPHIRIGYRTGTPSTYSTMPNGAVDNMIAYYNIFYHWYKIQPTQETNGDYYIDYLYVDTDGFVRVHTWDVNRGQFNDYYLLTRWDPIKVSGSGYNGSFDDTNIVNAINRIYNWLDNADLATNNTIITLVNDSQQDIDGAQGLYNLVKSLFKTAYGSLDDNSTLNDWTSAAGYFGNLWSDPTP